MVKQKGKYIIFNSTILVLCILIHNYRAANETYGDQAISYVELKRHGSVCTIQGHITAEHKIKKSYSVTTIIDEKEETIISAECLDCAAAKGMFVI